MTTWAKFEAVKANSPDPMAVLLNVDGQLVDFLSFHSYPPNEMFMEIAGFGSKKGTVTLSYPEREVAVPRLGRDEARYEFDDALACDVPLDHVSIHRNGTCHLKTSDRSSKPLRIGTRERIQPKTGLFLDAIITSDEVGKYESASEALGSAVKVPCSKGDVVRIRARFSGSEYSLESNLPLSKTSIMPAVALSGGPIKGLLFIEKLKSPEAERPPGTIVAFRFFTSDDTCIQTAFHVL